MVDGVRIRAQRHPTGWMLDGTKTVSSPTPPTRPLASSSRIRRRFRVRRDGVSAIVVETDRVGFQHWRPWPTIAVGRDTMELNLSARESARVQSAGRARPWSGLRQRPGSAPPIVSRPPHLTGVASAAQNMCRGAVWSRREHGAPLAQGERARLALADNEVSDRRFAGAVTCRRRIKPKSWHWLRHRMRLRRPRSVVDRAMDLHGVAGGSADLPLERWARESRWQRLSFGGDRSGEDCRLRSG